MTIREPAPRPCESCPYRQDVPSGVWAEEEYRKLPDYDQETMHQPSGVFLCHQGNNRVCGGWAAVCGVREKKDRRFELLSLRLASGLFGLREETVESIRDYRSPVPLFRSGKEAMEHGLKELEEPGEEACRIMDKIERKK